MKILLCMPKYIGPFLPGSNGGGAWGWMLEKQFKRLGWDVTFYHSFEPEPIPLDVIQKQDIVMFRHSYQVEFRRYKDIVSKARPETLIVHNYIDNSADESWESFGVCMETDVWLAQNEPHKKLVEGLGFKSMILHYPVDLDLMNDTPRLSKNLLYVGRFCPQKGVESLVESFRIIKKNHPDATLTMKGAWSWGVWEDPEAPGFFKYVDDMKKILDEVGGVTIVDDWSSPGSISDYYNKSSILIFPINAEGYGAPTIEAHSAAMPVVTSDHSSQLEKITEGIDGFCVKRDWTDRTSKKFMLPNPQAIADKVDFLFSDMDRIKSFGLCARSKAEKRYDQDKVMGGLITYLVNELHSKKERIEKA